MGKGTYLFLLGLLSALAALPGAASAQVERVFVPKSVVSLIVSGADEAHLVKHLKHLLWLKEKKQIIVGEVLVSGLRRYPQQQLSAGKSRDGSYFSGTRLLQLTANAGLSSQKVLELEKVFSRIDTKSSPTWVIRYRGRDYVYEGYTNLQGLFDNRGYFRDAQN